MLIFEGDWLIAEERLKKSDGTCEKNEICSVFTKLFKTLGTLSKTPNFHGKNLSFNFEF